MLIIIIILWLIIGFCGYIWHAKESYVTYFDWSGFLIITCLGLVSFIIIAIIIFIDNFPNFMEKLLKKLNK